MLDGSFTLFEPDFSWKINFEVSTNVGNKQFQMTQPLIYESDDVFQPRAATSSSWAVLEAYR